mgnify:FL=1
MKNQRNILIDQLDKKLKPFEGTEKVIVPDPGWIYSIRKSLNITLEQLAKKLKVTRQGIKKMEEREATGAITLNALKEIGEALNMKLVYGFVPVDGNIDQLIERKARELATKIVLRTHQHMLLENQGVGDKQIENSIRNMTQQLKQELNRSIWD